MFSKYDMSSLKIYFTEATTIGSSGFSSSLLLRCNPSTTIKRSFLDCEVGVKVKEKKRTNILGYVELIAKKIKE